MVLGNSFLVHPLCVFSHFFFVILSFYLVLSHYLLCDQGFPLQHPQLFSPTNQLSAVPTFYGFVDMSFVPCLQRLLTDFLGIQND